MNVSPEVFALVKRFDAAVTHTKFTIDGEVYVCKKAGVAFELPLEMEELDMVPIAAITDAETHAMITIYQFVESIRQINRLVPPTKQELKERIGSRKLRSLEKMGLIKSVMIPLLDSSKTSDKGEMKALGTRTCVYFTNQGRAFIREAFDDKYGTAGREHWESVREAAGAIRRSREDSSRAREDSAGLQHEVHTLAARDGVLGELHVGVRAANRVQSPGDK